MLSRIKRFTYVAAPLSVCYGYYKFEPVSVVWDLDNTLIKSYKKPKDKDLAKKSVNQTPFVIKSDNFKSTYDTYTRPYTGLVIPFLSLIGCKQYTYTAAVKEYGDIILNETKIKKYLKSSIAREQVFLSPDFYFADQLCYMVMESLKDVKDKKFKFKYFPKTEKYVNDNINKVIDKIYVFSLISEKLSKYDNITKKFIKMKYIGKETFQLEISDRIILVDDKVISHKPQDAGILIPKYDPIKSKDSDTELLSILWIIIKCCFANDITTVTSKSKYHPKQ